MMAPTLYQTYIPPPQPTSWMPIAIPTPTGTPVMSTPQAQITQIPDMSASPPLYHMSVTTCMEVVWHSEFTRRFAQFGSWNLHPTNTPPTVGDYLLFNDSAKVRFKCETCGKGWTSMKGRVAFWFKLDVLTGVGEVLFKLYGQSCAKCQDGDKFSHAMWYPEEVCKVVENIFNKVGITYYGFHLPPVRIDRRSGKPRAQHDRNLCQACKDGICKEGWVL